MSLSDDDNGHATQSTTALVTGVGLHNGVLQIVGTRCNDKVKVEAKGKSQEWIEVEANFLPDKGHERLFRADKVNSIVLLLGDGEDQAEVDKRIDKPVLIDGGAGNDYLTAGRGPAILLGGDGDHILVGGPGNDVLVGGAGDDLLVGGPAIDTLDGGSGKHLGFTITPGTVFSGGSYPSIVPNSATALVDIRLLPGQSSAEVIDLVQKQVQVVEKKRPRIRIEMKVTVDIPGAVIPKDHPLALLAQDYTEAVTGRRWETAGAGPANEGYMLIGAGIPTLCGFGPTGGNPHAPEEWVEIQSMPATVAIFAGIIHDILINSKENKNVSSRP